MSSSNGLFASPGYPESYPNGVDCVWVIGGSPGNHMTLSFTMFDLEASDHCNKDYIEIRSDDVNGPLIGRYCGNSIPTNITMAMKYWIKFRSDREGTAGGFVASYNIGRNKLLMPVRVYVMINKQFSLYLKTKPMKMT